MRRFPALCSLHAFHHPTTYEVIGEHFMPLCFRERRSCGIHGLISNALHFFFLRIPMSAIVHNRIDVQSSGCFYWAIRGWSLDPEAYRSPVLLLELTTEDTQTRSSTSLID